MNANNNGSPSGEVIYTYTRAQAIADGEQFDVSKVAGETAIRFPVFHTPAVFDAYVTVARVVKLVAMCGPLEIDDPAPAITVMLPDED